MEYNPNLAVSSKLRALEALLGEDSTLDKSDKKQLAQQLDSITYTGEDGEAVEESSNEDKSAIRALYDRYVGGITGQRKR